MCFVLGDNFGFALIRVKHYQSVDLYSVEIWFCHTVISVYLLLCLIVVSCPYDNDVHLRV